MATTKNEVSILVTAKDTASKVIKNAGNAIKEGAQTANKSTAEIAKLATQAETALRKMGLRGAELASALKRMGFETQKTAADSTDGAKAVEKLAESTTKAASGAHALAAGMSGDNDAFTQWRNQLQSGVNTVHGLTAGLSGNKKAFDDWRASTANATGSVHPLAAALSKSASETNKFGQGLLVLKAQQNAAKKSADALALSNQSLKDVLRSLANEIPLLNRALDLAKAFFTSLTGVVTAAGLALGFLAFKAVQAATRVQRGLLVIRNQLPGVGKDLTALRKIIADVSDEDPFGRTQEEITNIGRVLARNGTPNAEEFASRLRLVVQAANASGEAAEGLAEGIDLISDAFGLEGEALEDTFKRIIVAANGLVPLPDLFQALGRGSAHLDAFGVDAETAARAIASFADAGIPGREAGTALIRVLENLMEVQRGETEEALRAGRAFKALGIDLQALKDSGATLPQILQLIQEKTAGSVEALDAMGFTAKEATAIIRGDFREGVLSAAEAEEKWNEQTKSVGESADAAARRLKNSLNAELVTLGNKLLPPTVTLLTELNGLLDRKGGVGGAFTRELTDIARILDLLATGGRSEVFENGPIIRALKQLGIIKSAVRDAKADIDNELSNWDPLKNFLFRLTDPLAAPGKEWSRRFIDSANGELDNWDPVKNFLFRLTDPLAAPGKEWARKFMTSADVELNNWDKLARLAPPVGLPKANTAIRDEAFEPTVDKDKRKETPAARAARIAREAADRDKIEARAKKALEDQINLIKTRIELGRAESEDLVKLEQIEQSIRKQLESKNLSVEKRLTLEQSLGDIIETREQLNVQELTTIQQRAELGKTLPTDAERLSEIYNEIRTKLEDQNLTVTEQLKLYQQMLGVLQTMEKVKLPSDGANLGPLLDPTRQGATTSEEQQQRDAANRGSVLSGTEGRGPSPLAEERAKAAEEAIKRATGSTDEFNQALNNAIAGPIANFFNALIDGFDKFEDVAKAALRAVADAIINVFSQKAAQGIAGAIFPEERPSILRGAEGKTALEHAKAQSPESRDTVTSAASVTVEAAQAQVNAPVVNGEDTLLGQAPTIEIPDVGTGIVPEVEAAAVDVTDAAEEVKQGGQTLSKEATGLGGAVGLLGAAAIAIGGLAKGKVGGLLGGIAGFILGGPMGATLGASVGSQLGFADGGFVQAFAEGGVVEQEIHRRKKIKTEATYADGGIAQPSAFFHGLVTGPGGPKDDKIPAWLSDGEGILTAETTKALGGRSAIQRLNKLGRGAPKFMDGGVIDKKKRMTEEVTKVARYADGGVIGSLATQLVSHDSSATHYLSQLVTHDHLLRIPKFADGGVAGAAREPGRAEVTLTLPPGVTGETKSDNDVLRVVVKNRRVLRDMFTDDA